MLVFPNAKINIGLNITEKRSDGYHNLETVFYPIALHDALEFIESTNKDEASFKNTGLTVDSHADSNLCVKAYKLLANDFQLPSIKIHLHKIIPFGAGLGGGSSDAAFMLKALNEHFNLNLSNLLLKEYAAKLGSDCAFFIDNRPSFGYGRGELLEPVELNLSKYYFVLVRPDVLSNTSEAYAGISPKFPEKSLQDLIKLPVEEWKNLIKNDFENSIFTKYPVIKNIKEKFYSKGAVYAQMSGSGSSVFALFNQKVDLQNEFNGCFYWSE